MAFQQEQFDTGLAGTALGALVFLVLLAGGLLILGRFEGALFGASPDPGNPYGVLDAAPLAEPAAPAVDAPPPPAESAPGPISAAPGPPVPVPPAPGPASPVALPPGDEPPSGAESGLTPVVSRLASAADDTVTETGGGLVDTTADTLHSAANTVGHVLDAGGGLLPVDKE